MKDLLSTLYAYNTSRNSLPPHRWEEDKSKEKKERRRRRRNEKFFTRREKQRRGARCAQCCQIWGKISHLGEK
jgi:hypothetical protein